MLMQVEERTRVGCRNVLERLVSQCRVHGEHKIARGGVQMEAEGGLKWVLVYFELGYEHGFQGRG